MMDLITVLLIMAGIFCIVCAKKYNIKVLYFVGAALLLADVIIAATDFGTGFGEGMITPR